MTKRNDYILAVITGFFTGLFLQPVLRNTEFIFPYGLPHEIILVIIPILWMFGILLGSFLSRWFAIMAQISRYTAAGFLSFSIDFGILNMLIFFTDITVGKGYALFKGISYIVANINAYLWNKYWVFHVRDIGGISVKNIGKEYGTFFAVSVIGFIINVSIASFIVNVISPQFGFEEKGWANIGAIIAAGIAILWNFVGYKFIVFKKKEDTNSAT